jgi:hypothetical protein
MKVSRRNALFGGAAAVTMPLPIIQPDAAVIAAVDRLLANQADLYRLSDRRITIEGEHETEAECEALMDRTNDIIAELEQLPPPTSSAGIVAYARAALVMHPRDIEGGRFATDHGEWLSLVALEQLVAA